MLFDVRSRHYVLNFFKSYLGSIASRDLYLLDIRAKPKGTIEFLHRIVQGTFRVGGSGLLSNHNRQQDPDPSTLVGILLY